MHPLRHLRDVHNLSRDDVAEVVGVSGSQITHVELGRWSFSTEKWMRLWDAYKPEFEALGYSLEDVMRGGRDEGEGAA